VTSIIDTLKLDKPCFHGQENSRTSWNSNLNLLSWFDGHLQQGWRTLEVGSGYSTLVFLSRGCRHTSVTPDAKELERIKAYCLGREVPITSFSTRVGYSTTVLPTLQGECYDFIFIDGAHRFPYPMVDFHYCRGLLQTGGLLAIDDIDIVSCNLLLNFLKGDPFWEQVEVRQNYAVFRKLGDETGYDWDGQPFSMKKIPLPPEPREGLLHLAQRALRKVLR
jgi:hypothetical protein